MRSKTVVLLESNGALLSELKEALAKNEGLNVAYVGTMGKREFGNCTD